MEYCGNWFKSQYKGKGYNHHIHPEKAKLMLINKPNVFALIYLLGYGPYSSKLVAESVSYLVVFNSMPLFCKAYTQWKECPEYVF
jgi:hypothetical protein